MGDSASDELLMGDKLHEYIGVQTTFSPLIEDSGLCVGGILDRFQPMISRSTLDDPGMVVGLPVDRHHRDKDGQVCHAVLDPVLLNDSLDGSALFPFL